MQPGRKMKKMDKSLENEKTVPSFTRGTLKVVVEDWKGGLVFPKVTIKEQGIQ